MGLPGARDGERSVTLRCSQGQLKDDQRANVRTFCIASEKHCPTLGREQRAALAPCRKRKTVPQLGMVGYVVAKKTTFE
jgi:50S ribosomal subunit-associated GTPase HflX